MGRIASDATLLRNERKKLREVVQRLIRAEQDIVGYRARTVQAEVEVNAWKERFDKLLSRTPEQPKRGL